MADPPIPCSAACRFLFHSPYSFALPCGYLVAICFMDRCFADLRFLLPLKYLLCAYSFSGCLGAICYYAFFAPAAPRTTFGHSRPRPQLNRNPGFFDRRLRPLARHRHILLFWARSAALMMLPFFFEEHVIFFLASLTGGNPIKVKARVGLLYLAMPAICMVALLIMVDEEKVVEEANEEEEEEERSHRGKNKYQKKKRK